MSKHVTIVDYKAGNMTSVKLTLDALGVTSILTDEPKRILDSDRIIFPGVGAIGSAMNNLEKLGLIEPMREVAKRGTPLLGTSQPCPRVVE